jgi:ABC-type lipoprotein release transport system permease subunit
MYSILWQHWIQRPSRFAFTLISLILSTATLVGIVVASHNARSSFKELGTSVQGLPSLDVVNEQGGRFELALLEDLPLPESALSSMPTLIRGSVIRFKERKSRGLILGLPLDKSDPESRDFLKKSLELDENQWPRQDECLLSSLIATQLGAAEGDTIQCLFRRGFRKLLVKRVVPGNVWNRIASEHGAIVDLDWLQKAAALAGQIDRVRFYLASDNEKKKEQLTAQLDGRIPENLKVKERTNTIGLADDLLKSTELGLSFASALAVAMAAYILLNTTRMNLAERRPYFAILRCLGAKSSQITNAVILEALIISLSGVVFGLAAGCGLGLVMGRILSGVLQTPPGSFSVPWLALLLIALFVPCLTLAVVWFAQKQQDEISPLESFREPDVASTRKFPWKSILKGSILWCIAMFGMACVQQEWISAQWGVIAGLATLISYLLLLPLGLVPLVWIIDRLARLPNGFPLEVAKNQLVQRPERTTLNAGFLVISLCGAVGLGQTLMSNTAEIKRWYNRTLPGELFLIGTQPPTLVIDSEDPLRERIKQLPGLKWSNALRFVWCQVDEKTVLGIVREFPKEAPFPTEPKGMTTESARQTIDGDSIFIGSILAKKLGKKAGDSLSFTLNGRSFPMAIGGVNSNFANGGMSFIMNRATAQRYFEVTGFDWYAISVAPEHLDAAQLSMESVQEQYGFEIQRGSEMRKGVEQAISGVTAGIWSVVFISFLTGGFGIATTLAMNMIEQARDFSLIRIVGGSRSQLMLTVLVQAWLLGAIGIFFGMVGGITTVLIILACSEALLGYTPEFEWNPLLMVGSGLGTLAIVTLAAWLPAWNAAKINPVEHLNYE